MTELINKRAPTAPTNFRILAVCTGNVCRSPAIERWLAAALHDTSVSVTSAGAHALVGAPVEPMMSQYIRMGGGAVEGFAAQQLERALVSRSDLILTASHAHSALVVAECAEVRARTFTLREFARLMREARGAVSPEAPLHERLAAAVRTAHRQRLEHPFASTADDVVDPIGRDDGAYALAADQLWFGVRGTIDALTGEDTPSRQGQTSTHRGTPVRGTAPRSPSTSARQRASA